MRIEGFSSVGEALAKWSEQDDNKSAEEAQEQVFRVFYKECEDSQDHTELKALCQDVRGFKGAAWRELSRNVPSSNKPDNLSVVLASKPKGFRGPIAVLVGLKYSGNVGAIVRSVVQSGAFQAIHIIDERGSRVETVDGYTREWGKDSKRVPDKDIEYYSMYNAPLIEIKRFTTVHSFVQSMEPERELVAVELSPRSVSLYSKQAQRLFQQVGSRMYFAIGAEDTGIPEKLLQKASALVQIPCLSASVNVACAFSACLAVFMCASHEQTDEQEHTSAISTDE